MERNSKEFISIGSSLVMRNCAVAYEMIKFIVIKLFLMPKERKSRNQIHWHVEYEIIHANYKKL